jgi:hypothetical protein
MSGGYGKPQGMNLQNIGSSSQAAGLHSVTCTDDKRMMNWEYFGRKRSCPK